MCSFNTRDEDIPLSEIMDRCVTAGHTPDQVDKCLDEYEKLNVWQLNQNRTCLRFCI